MLATRMNVITHFIKILADLYHATRTAIRLHRRHPVHRPRNKHHPVTHGHPRLSFSS